MVLEVIGVNPREHGIGGIWPIGCDGRLQQNEGIARFALLFPVLLSNAQSASGLIQQFKRKSGFVSAGGDVQRCRGYANPCGNVPSRLRDDVQKKKATDPFGFLQSSIEAATASNLYWTRGGIERCEVVLVSKGDPKMRTEGNDRTDPTQAPFGNGVLRQWVD